MQPLLRPAGTLAFLLAWVVPWRPAFRVRAGDSNLEFFVHRRDAIGRHIAKYGTHEPLVSRWIADYLSAARPGIVVDVGANVGWHALHAARHANVEAVIAFEPDTLNAWLLERNIARNGMDKVIVETRAVGVKPGVARFYRYKQSNFGRHSLMTDFGYGSRSVPLTDIDSALDGLGFDARPVSLIKIDVEGGEPAVIAGASRTLARCDAIILEYSPQLSSTGALSAGEMTAQLYAAGFTAFALRSGGGTVAIERSELDGFEGQLDLVWLKAAIAQKFPGRERGQITLQEIAEQNKHVVRAI